jgi:uncharacterized cupin superfamily protein
MKITRIYAGPDGQSHFGETEISFEGGPGGIGQQSDRKATDVLFRERKGRHESEWHHVAQKQLVILLDGEIEVEIGDGAKRHFKAGDFFLCEDMTGQGHKVHGMNRKTIVVMLT